MSRIEKTPKEQKKKRTIYRLWGRRHIHCLGGGVLYICVHAPHVFSAAFFFSRWPQRHNSTMRSLQGFVSLARLHTTSPPRRHSCASLCQQSGSATCERRVDERNPAKTKGTRQALEYIIHIWQSRRRMISLLPKQMSHLKLIFHRRNVLKMNYGWFFSPFCFCHEDMKRHSHCHAINLFFFPVITQTQCPNLSFPHKVRSFTLPFGPWYHRLQTPDS